MTTGMKRQCKKLDLVIFSGYVCIMGGGGRFMDKGVCSAD